MRKRIINQLVGFIASVVFTAAPGLVTAAEMQALEANYPIYLNGQEWKSERPPVVIGGSTYLPLKAIGDALDVPVIWNTELRRVEIGEVGASNQPDRPDVPAKSIFSRENPAPLNTAQTITVKNTLDEYTATVNVTEVIRGEDAWKIIRHASEYNAKPDKGYEYILAKVSVTAESISGGRTIYVSPTDFDCFSSGDAQYDHAFVVPPSPELSGLIEAGSGTSGYVAFCVRADDKDPKIVYKQRHDGTGGLWFKL
ncbi:MAG: DUF4352 domain-containing protein [Spirochaetaceae bacterium]|nr:DUF4352 domain-containing protein [Spirochaetaceae bacterium]